MTAVVGILNKSAVAIAADSAVTISGAKGRKIFNNANKIFNLSKRFPIGIMIYNSAAFMGIPWEILIKEYRSKLGEGSFNTVEEYKDDFILYLKKNINLVSGDVQKKHLYWLVDSIFDFVIKNTLKDNKAEIEKQRSEKKKRETLVIKIEEKINQLVDGLSNNRDFLIEFKKYTYKSFSQKNISVLQKCYDEKFSNISISTASKNKLFKFIYFHIKSKNFVGSWTGLIFTGYGEKEIYPSIIPLKIGSVIDNKIRYIVDKNQQTTINEKTTGAIKPFAQRDVIDTFLTGINSELEDIYEETFKQFFENYNKTISQIVSKNDKQLGEAILNLDINKIVSNYKKELRSAQQIKFVTPTMTTISTLSKEDLAEMAESLIYLTYLKRRTSFSEESVGGPVDVALISKGDGFIWIKRKHYFSTELNPIYFQKYLK